MCSALFLEDDNMCTTFDWWKRKIKKNPHKNFSAAATFRHKIFCFKQKLRHSLIIMPLRWVCCQLLLQLTTSKESHHTIWILTDKNWKKNWVCPTKSTLTFELYLTPIKFIIFTPLTKIWALGLGFRVSLFFKECNFYHTFRLIS